METLLESRVKSKFGFSIGDKVCLVAEDPTGYVAVGQFGIVCDFDHTFSDGCNVGIELDYKSRGNHNCNHRCRDLRGRYVPHTAIVLADVDLGEIEANKNDINMLFTVI